jgi:hypothetical protein
VNGPELTPIQRLVLAFYALFAVLFHPEFALAVHRLREAYQAGKLPPPPGPEPEEGGGVSASRATVEPAWTAGAPATKAPPPSGPELGQPKPVAVPAPPPAEARAELRPMEPVRAPEPKPEVKAEPRPEPALKPEPKPEPALKPEPKPEPLRAPDTRAAVQLLSLLQREGRLVDFIEEDLTGFPDSAIGAAARTVHAGCKKAIQELFQLEPVYREPEGAQVTVGAGFDPAAIRLTGNVVGSPPFKGSLRHHGWRAREVKLPSAPDGKDPGILAPAEVEL